VICSREAPLSATAARLLSPPPDNAHRYGLPGTTVFTGCGAALFAGYFAACIAAGRPLAPGLQAGEAGAVACLRGSQRDDLLARLEALRRQFGTDLGNLAVIEPKPQLDFGDAGSVSALVAVCRALGSLSALIIDDLSQYTSLPDETNGRRMAGAVAALHRLGGALSCPIIATQREPARGLLYFQTDAVYAVERRGQRLAVTALRTRGAARPPALYFDLIGDAVIPADR
jgi:hypothetical protein